MNANVDHVALLRSRLAALPGTQESKARELNVGVSWYQKFIDGRIKYPRADRYELIRQYVEAATTLSRKAA